MIGPADVVAVRETLLAGGLAIVPTDTVYGLAAALDSPEGVDALYALKGRPRSQPCQVLIFTEALLAEAVTPLDDLTVRAIRAILPGQATCIIPDPTGRYAAATGDQPGAVGLRAPRMDGAILGLDIPLVATSANDPGGADPAAIGDVPTRLRGVGTPLDVGRLPGTASAVVDLRGLGLGDPAMLIRPGPDPAEVGRRLQSIGVDLSLR